MKLRKGFLRLSIALSILVMFFIVIGIIMILPNDKDISLICYNQVLTCNGTATNEGNRCLWNDQSFVHQHAPFGLQPT